jgi:hypothetical protein
MFITFFICREVHLPDGRRLLRHDRYDAVRHDNKFSEQQMMDSGILRIHPSFRIIAVGNPPDRENPWLVAEVLSMFSFVDTLNVHSLEDKISVIFHISPPQSSMEKDLLYMVQNACQQLEVLEGGDMNVSAGNLSPSCRQLLRLWKSSKSDMNRALAQYAVGSHIEFKNDLINNVNDKIMKMVMARFMPAAMRSSFESSLTKHAMCISEEPAIFASTAVEESVSSLKMPSDETTGEIVRIGNKTLTTLAPKHPELVPDTRFVSIKKHISYLESIADDVMADERHLLLIGNQGRSVEYISLIGKFV